MTSRLRAACSWWVEFLTVRPAAWRAGAASRPTAHLWTDAAGESRWLAAVVRANGAWFWTRSRVPPEVWAQFTPGGDAQIGMQELLAVALGYYTFSDMLAGLHVFSFIDNTAVLFNLLHGGASAEDINMSVGKMWLDFAHYKIAFYGVRVESKANVADGPTRDEISILEQLGATFREPRFPAWVRDIWSFPSHA